MKRVLLGWVCLFSTCLAQGDGEVLYKQGTAVYKSDPAQAFGFFIQAAELGNVSAMVGVGHGCETGTGTSVDYTKAIEWYEKAVAHNSLKACDGLARIYASCDDPEFHDGEKAVKYAGAITRKNPRDAEALALLAAAHARNIDFKQAVKVQATAQRIAPLNDMKAYKRQISKYARGEPRPPKATEAWLLRAADVDARWAIVTVSQLAGDPDEAMYNPQLALRMCQQGIDLGEKDLYVQKGRIYFNMSDFNKAYAAYEEARRKGCYTVETRLISHLKKPRDEVFSWAEKYRNGYIETTTVRGIVGHEEGYHDSYGNYYQGDPIYGDIKKEIKHPPRPEWAQYLYEVAAKKEHPRARSYLKAGIDTIPTSLPEIYKKGGVHRRANALVDQARKYEKGDGLVKDQEKALQLYIQAYEIKRSATIAYEIGSLYLQIRKPERRVELGVEWIKKAIELGRHDANWGLANFYATDRDPSVRNGKEAVKYAKAYVKGQEDSFGAYKTLAQAYARNGQFKEAEATMIKAISMLRETEFHDRYIDSFNKQLRQFRNGCAWPPES